jgi:beta-carotene 15,15'-monooxygenase
MLRLFEFGGDDGDGEIRYANRFLRSDAYRDAERGRLPSGFATGGAGLLGRLKAFLIDDPYDNANVIAERVGDRHLALTETPRRAAFDPATLETLGHVQYDGRRPSGQLACAHLGHDPLAGTTVNVEVEFGPTSKYHVLETTAPTEREHVVSLRIDEPAYMHSFALTPSYVVLTEFPFVIDPLSLLTPGSDGGFIDNFRWEPERGTRFLVVDRESGSLVAEPVTEGFFGWHHVNAFERPAGGGPAATGAGALDDPELVVDLETVPDAPSSVDALTMDALRDGWTADVFAGTLERFRLRPEADDPGIERERLYDGGTALPTTPPGVWLHDHRYVYAQAVDRPVTEWPRSVVRVDVESGTGSTFAAGDHYLSEPIAVEHPGATAGDDAVVLTVGLDPDAERSRLFVLDAASMTERARVTLPHALPFDFHGRFFDTA